MGRPSRLVAGAAEFGAGLVVLVVTRWRRRYLRALLFLRLLPRNRRMSLDALMRRTFRRHMPELVANLTTSNVLMRRRRRGD